MSKTPYQDAMRGAKRILDDVEAREHRLVTLPRNIGKLLLLPLGCGILISETILHGSPFGYVGIALVIIGFVLVSVEIER